MNESSHQKRYKSSSTSMSMALAEASIQSLLDFLRLNLWIWFDGFHKKGSLDKGKGRGGGGKGWKELRMKERRSVTAWTILYALNAELSSSTVKLGLFLTRKNKQTTTTTTTKNPKGFPKDKCHISLLLFSSFSSSPTCVLLCQFAWREKFFS